MNRKRVQRLWREEGLRVPVRRRKRRRLGDSTVPAARLAAERPDHVWAIDFQFDQTADGRILKLLHVVDEFTREALVVECRRRIDADRTVTVLDRILATRGRSPEFIRCDNGPEFTANALRDWCHFSRAGSAYIEPGSPWQNAYVESFGSRIRDELLAVEIFSCLAEAQVMVEDSREDYNEHRPHSALGMQAPAKFAKAWRARQDTLAACRVAGTVARPGSHRTVLVLFTHGSSGRRVANPAASRFLGDLGLSPLHRKLPVGGGDDLLVPVAVQLHKADEPTVGEEPSPQGIVDLRDVAQRP